MTTRSNRVEVYRVDPSYAEVAVGDPVKARTWESAARLLHWVRGRGRCLVPAHHPRYTISSASSSTLRYFVAPSGAAITRVWVLDVRASTKTGSTRFTVQAGASATSGPILVDGYSANSLPVIYIETGCTQATTPLEISCVIDPTAGTARVESVACYELPRDSLDASGSPEYGLSLDSYYPRNDVYESSTSGLYGLAVSTAATDARRIGHVYFWHDTGVSTTSATFVDVYPTPPRIVPAKDRVADTTRLVSFNAWALADDGTTSGEVRVKDAAGNVSAAIAIPLLGTTGAWRGPGELAFLCEDLTKSDGVRAGAERIQFQFRRTAGAGTITMHGWGAYEKP